MIHFVATKPIVKLVFKNIKTHEKIAHRVLSGFLFTDQNELLELIGNEGYLQAAQTSLMQTPDLQVRIYITWGLSNYVCSQEHIVALSERSQLCECIMEMALGNEIALVTEAMFVLTNAIYYASAASEDKVLQRILLAFKKEDLACAFGDFLRNKQCGGH